MRRKPEDKIKIQRTDVKVDGKIDQKAVRKKRKKRSKTVGKTTKAGEPVEPTRGNQLTKKERKQRLKLTRNNKKNDEKIDKKAMRLERKQSLKAERMQPKQGDLLLLIAIAVLVVFGIVMVFSSSYYYAMSKLHNPYNFLKKDIIWVGVGAVLMFVTAKIPYWIYRKIAVVGLIGSIGLLGLVLTSLGKDINGAKRWIDLGPITIMPGEIAKICAIIFIAWYLSLKKDRAKDFLTGVLPCLCVAGLYFGLIILQPNLSTATTIVFIIVGMLIVAGIDFKYIVGIFIFGLSGIAVMIKIAPYRLKRFTTFLHPFEDPLGDGYQVVQSLLALGSGGLLGVGLGKSVQKALYLPEPHNDFIFAIIGEELGFIGAVLLICIYIFAIWRGMNIALNSPDMFGCLLASGITIMLASQVLINIAVATSSMPATGISLPFISWGGNSLAIFMASMGILYNISKYIIGSRE